MEEGGLFDDDDPDCFQIRHLFVMLMESSIWEGLASSAKFSQQTSTQQQPPEKDSSTES